MNIKEMVVIFIYNFKTCYLKKTQKKQTKKTPALPISFYAFSNACMLTNFLTSMFYSHLNANPAFFFQMSYE